MVEVCDTCPRRCAAKRGDGFCGAPEEVQVASICLHRGEEPPLSGTTGMVNIFFAHCNLQCIYCQNGTISGRNVEPALVRFDDCEAIADEVCRLLPQSSGLVGFVTAAHYSYAIPAIADAIARRGCRPIYVYNSSGYESVEALQRLEGLIDIYLPDLKYMDSRLAEAYSHAADYPEVATRALLEMKRQVGGGLKVDGDIAYRGMIVRHLVLPGAVGNTLQCLDWLADNFTPYNLHLSLMAQYFPPSEGLPTPLNRRVEADEYAAAAEHYNKLGFAGWLQEMSSQQCYRPDFSNPDIPFAE